MSDIIEIEEAPDMIHTSSAVETDKELPKSAINETPMRTPRGSCGADEFMLKTVQAKPKNQPINADLNVKLRQNSPLRLM